MLTGVYAARNVIGETNDVWTVNTEMEYHEEANGKEARFGDRLTPARVTPPATTQPHLSPDEIIERAFAKLDPLALGVAVGLVCGLVLFFMTFVLLLKGGAVVGSNLSLLANYFLGYQLNWLGAVIGFFEASLGGFALGLLAAWLRNWSLEAYATFVQKRMAAADERNLLDKVL